MTRDQAAAIARRVGLPVDTVEEVFRAAAGDFSGYGFDRHDTDDGQNPGQPGTRQPLRVRSVRSHHRTIGDPAT